MPILRELLARELLMLAVSACIGAGPASLLSGRFRAVERVALAPVLGMCFGTCVFTTLFYFFRAGDTAWLVPVLALASLAVAAVRSRHAVGGQLIRSDRAGWLSLVLVAVLVSLPIVSVMRSQHTVGPASYAVGDATGYVGEIDGEDHESLRTAIHAQPPWRNLADHYLDAIVDGDANLDLTPLQANVDSLVGLGSTSTWEAFMIAFLVAGAFGALAAVRWVLRSGTGVARALGGTMAGVMFSGAFFLQLVFADSEAGMCGLSLLLPLAAIAADTVEGPRWAAVALLALPVSGLIATYPIFVAPVAATAAVALLLLAARGWRAGNARGRILKAGLLRVVFLVAVAFCLNVVSFTRDLRYWKALITGSFDPNSFGFPQFDMKISTLPSWLLQTRNLFSQIPFSSAGFGVTVEEIVLPVALFGVMVVALRSRPILLWLVAVIGVAALFGEHEATKYACSYCTDRSLLPIGPMLIGLLAVGAGVLWMTSRPLLRTVGIAVILLWFVPAFTSQRDLRNRVSGGGTFVASSDRAVLAELPHGASVDVEGFDADPWSASPDEPLVYELTEELSGAHATIPGDISDYNSIAYFGATPLGAEDFNPNYRYVLTRIPGVDTSRRTIARYFGVALQKRVSPLDVTVDSGIVAPSEALDPSGTVWVSNGLPLHLIVSGRTLGPAYVGIEMTAAVPATLPPQSGVVAGRRGNRIFACARSTGTAPVRVADVQVTYTPEPYPKVVGTYAQPPVEVGVQLDALAVSAKGCPFDGLRPPKHPTSVVLTGSGTIAPASG